jgi:TonB-linked SusC/RagA family outer membrane protein
MKRGFTFTSLFTLLLLCCAFSLVAQQKTVTGKIVDQQTKQPLPGATVNIKGTNQGVSADPSGTFSIQVPGPSAVLVVSFMGYGTQELTVGQQSAINISLSNSVSNVNEVVVIGYGQVKKRDLTGSVVSIKGDEAVKVPSSTVVEALQGKIPGADIYRDNGYAGGQANIRLRGTRSIGNPASSNNVLYIVDGVQGVNMGDIDPNDIQSVEVLKDASSTSIYGSRGANGVIIITTKRGMTGKPKLTFSSYAGVSEVSKYGRMKTGPEYIAFKREAYRAAGTWNSPADDAAIFNPQELTAIQNQEYIDWSDMLLHKGSQQNYQVGVSGGTEKTKIYFSAGYYKEKGILKDDGFKRYSARFNIDQTINNWLKAGISSQYAYIDNDTRRDPFNQASKSLPLGKPFDENGNVILFPLGRSEISPLADEQPGEWDSNIRTNRFSGSAYLEATPLEGLQLRSTFATTQEGRVIGQFYGKNSINGQGSNSQSSVNNSQNSFISWENLLTYRKQFNDHALEVTGVTSYIQNVNTGSWGSGRNQIFPSQSWYNLGGATQSPVNGSNYSKYALLSFTGRINYSYLGRYLLTLTGRTDGSSKLGEGNKWAFFPSAAVGWRISDEAFMKKQSIFDDLKLRVSYGISGNDVIGPYQTLSSLTQIPFSYDESNQAPAYGINPTIGNPDLKWELTATTNIGLDFSILNNRISGTIDYYNARTYNLIFPYTLPGSTGVATINRNVGETTNKGVEVSLTSNNFNGPAFRWTSTITYARNKERITELPNGNVIANDYRQSLIIGQSPTIYYDYVKLGIWQLNEAEEAAKYQALPGDIKIADLSGPDGKPDGRISAEDRTIIGTRVPKWTGGISNDFSYKNFDLNILFIARIGQWMSSDYYAKYYRNGSQNGLAMDYWTPENPTNDYPRPHATRSSSYVTTLTEYENSYIKLRNVTLGYTLPKSLTSRAKIDNVKIYVSGKNLWFYSKNNKDFDPESEGIIDAPLNRLFVMGLNVTF